MRLPESLRRPEQKFQTTGKSQQHLAQNSSARSQRDLSNFTVVSPSAATACNWPGQLKWLRPIPFPVRAHRPVDPPAPVETRNNTANFLPGPLRNPTQLPVHFTTFHKARGSSTGGALGPCTVSGTPFAGQGSFAVPVGWLCLRLWSCSRSANGPALPFCRHRFAPVSPASQTIIRRQRGM